MSVQSAAANGNTRATLEAMRDELAEAMDAADVAVKAQISGQLLKVIDALEALPAEKGSIVDDLANRRADRVAKARASAPPNRQKRQRRS